MNELAELLGLDKSSTSGLVDRAQRRGLVRRVPSQLDRRSVRVRLTEQRQRAGAAAARPLRQGHRPLAARCHSAALRILRALAAVTRCRDLWPLSASVTSLRHGISEESTGGAASPRLPPAVLGPGRKQLRLERGRRGDGDLHHPHDRVRHRPRSDPRGADRCRSSCWCCSAGSGPTACRAIA